LASGVCPSLAAQAAVRHACCENEKPSDCATMAQTVTCCAAPSGESTPAGTPAAPTVKIAHAPTFGHLAIVPAQSDALTARRPAATHGVVSLDPLLRTCLRRV
jgi:hypothetical protein